MNENADLLYSIIGRLYTNLYLSQDKIDILEKSIQDKDLIISQIQSFKPGTEEISDK